MQSVGLPRPHRFRMALATLAIVAAGLWAAAPAPARQSSSSQPSGAPASAAPAKGKAKQGKAGAAAPATGAASAPAAGAPASSGAPAGSGAAGGALGGSPPPDMGSIDQILEGDEEVLSGNNGFTYDPGNRRDPFKSLLIAPDRPEFRGPRPEGIPGLLIDEIDLKGIIRTARGYVAQVNASNQKKSYLLKEGDQLYDGDVVSIGKNEVVFKQIVQDPTALKPFREIVKSLTPQ